MKKWIITVLGLAALTAGAATKTWNGNGSNANTGNASNWGGTAPVINTSYDVVFDAANIIGPTYFQKTAVFNTTGLGFSSLTLTGAGSTNFILMDSVTPVPTTLNGPITVNSGTHRFNVTTTVTTDSTWNIANGAELGLRSAAGHTLILAADKKITKTGEGNLWFETAQNNIAGTIQLDAGTITAQATNSMGTASLLLNGGTLALTRDTSSIYGNNVTVGGNTTITSGRATVSAGTVYQQLGTLSIGGQTLTVGTGGFVTNGSTAKLVFGATTLTGGAVFNVTNNVSGVTSILSLGDVNGANGLTKTGDGELLLRGANTYSGNTTVSMGLLTMADNSGLQFVIGGNGVNNQINGSGTATLAGDFTFDLSGASQTVGDSWTIVDVASLNETFTSTFTVVGFTDAGGDLWTKDINGSTYYQFSEGTGVLNVIPEPATIGMLGLGTVGLLIFRRRLM